MSPTLINYEQTDAYKELAGDDDPVFNSYTSCFMFFATLGYSKARKVEDPGGKEELRWEYIEGDAYRSNMAASLAYAATKDPDALLDAEKQIKVLREYAAGGAEVAQQEILDKPGDKLDNLIEFLKRERDTSEGHDKRIGVLEEIEEEMSQFS